VVDGVKAASDEATTTFVTDANVVATSVVNPSYTPKSLYMAASDNYIQDIKTYLMKPQQIATGFFTSSDTVSTFSSVAPSFPHFFSTIPMWVEKVRGFFGIRMDLSFRLVVNATRFQQGRYMLLWKPAGGVDVSFAKNIAMIAGHVMTLVQRTQMPHAEIDINCDSEIEFKVPFSSQYNFAHVRSITNANFYNSMGIIQIYPYVPLNAVAGSLSCGYTLYVSAENVELISAADPQSGRFTTNTRKKNETESEQQSVQMGPISSVLTRISKATSVLSGVPLISSYAHSASWLTDVAARTASVFGYSRPVNLGKASRMTKEIFPYIANTDGPDNSFPIALSYNNELGAMTGISPTDLDEMDFTFLATIPVYERIISWVPATVSGTALASWGVGPWGGLSSNVTVNGQVLQSFPPYKYLSNFFKFWRGTFVYKFKIVKTEFHSGRLSFSFTPRTTSQGNVSTPSAINLPYIHREIVDIRIDNEVTFKVPFVSDTPWKLCRSFSAGNAHITGLFSVHVVDPLVAPETVPQTVSIIVEISMAPDVEFAVPYSNAIEYNPFYGAAPQMGAFDGSSKPEVNSCNEITTTIGAMSTLDDSHNSAFLCIGEKISSLRKMLRRAVPLIWSGGGEPADSPRLRVVPFAISMLSQNGVTNTTPTVLADQYSAFSSMYLYSRGSVRLKYVNSPPVPSDRGDEGAGVPANREVRYTYKLLTDFSGVVTNYVVSYISSVNSYNSSDFATAQVVVSGNENQEFQIPHYHRFPLRNKFDHSSNAQYPYSYYTGDGTGAATELMVDKNVAPSFQDEDIDSTLIRVYRATADDCTLSYFLSIPPVVSLSGV